MASKGRAANGEHMYKYIVNKLQNIGIDYLCAHATNAVGYDFHTDRKNNNNMNTIFPND